MADTGLGDLHFVDHVECKMISPEKEVISPTKGLKSPVFPVMNGSSKDEDQENESKNCDSGLDSSNDNSENQIISESPDTQVELENEHFIDRQESHTSVDEPEVISPSKPGQQQFSYQESEEQSLDVANNNSQVPANDFNVEAGEPEAAVQENVTGTYVPCTETSQISTDNQEALVDVKIPNTASDAIDIGAKETIADDIYLGKEVSLHVKEAQDEGTNREVSSATMNLYWYSGTALNVDLDEIEAFKTSQTETYTSSMQITTGNGYYEAKSQTEQKENGIDRSVDNKTDIKSDKMVSETWAPAFESASSRILDLASEMKTQPKGKMAVEGNEQKPEEQDEHHPWGLEREEKVVAKNGDDGAEILPDIDSFQSENSYAVSEGDQIVEAQINTVVSAELSSALKDSQVYTPVVGLSEMKDNEKDDVEDLHIDEADAVGYMKLNDKPVDEGSKDTTVKPLEKDNENNNVPDTERVSENLVGNDIEIDAVGYMLLEDKPIIEQTIGVTEQSSLEISMNANARVDVPNQSNKAEELILPESSKAVFMEQREDNTLSNLTQQETAISEIDVVDSIKLMPEGEFVKELVEKSETRALEVVETEPVYDPYTVKRTYKINNDSETAIQNIGGLFIETETFVDEYLDDDNYSLTLQDCWLRLRNKKFEMKVDAAFGCYSGKSQLLTSEPEIKETLLNMFSKELEQKRRVSERHLDVLVDSLTLIEFATFETVRKRYQVGSCIVTVDVTNFGVQNGQIEMVASNPAEIPDVLNTMERLALDIGRFLSPFSSSVFNHIFIRKC